MRVSVVMPVYNVEKYLKSSIESVLKQNYRDYELILIDDGSPDTSPEICDEYARIYSNIKVIHKENGGLSSARNIGIEAAEGDYILFLDSDDTIDENLLQDIMRGVEENDVDMVMFGRRIYVIENGEIISKRDIKFENKLIENHKQFESLYIQMVQNSMLNFVTDKLFRRKTITDNNIHFNSFFDRVCEDTIFILDIFPFLNKVNIVDKCYYNYFIREGQSVVKTFIPERYEKYYARYLKTCSLMDNFKPQNKNQGYLYELYVTFIIWAYEFMFHPNCNYSIFKRYEYLKKTFSIRRESVEFCRHVERYIRDKEIYENSSGSTKKVVKCILNNRYIMAWIYHLIALFRSKINA